MSAARALVAPLLLATVLVGPTVGARGSEGGHHGAAEIQARIAAASPGAVIVVAPGMYHGNLIVDTPVTLRGSQRPLIVGDGTGTVISVTAPGAVIEGLRVRGSGIGPVGGPAGIRVEADDVTVRDVVVEDSYMGISVYGASGARLMGNTIRGREQAAIADEGHATSAEPPDEVGGPTGEHANHAAGDQPTPSGRIVRGDGISLWNAEDALVRDNLVSDARDGIYLSFGTGALIDRNQVTGSRYAIHSMFARELVLAENRFERNLSGIVLMYGGPVLLLRNDVRDSTSPSTGFGLLLKDVPGVDAVENVIVGNRVGIQVDGPTGQTEEPVVIHGNTVATNRFGVSLYPSAQATFYRNSFVENAVQVVAQGNGVAGKNTWAHAGVGNYWSSYRGYDLMGEGVGDVPHVEGGTVERLLVRTPVLQALSSGPAFGLLRAVEDRWVEHDPIVVDPLPLMRPASPALAGPEAGAAASVALVGAGALALALAVWALRAFRRPSRGRPIHAG